MDTMRGMKEEKGQRENRTIVGHNSRLRPARVETYNGLSNNTHRIHPSIVALQHKQLLNQRYSIINKTPRIGRRENDRNFNESFTFNHYKATEVQHLQRSKTRGTVVDDDGILTIRVYVSYKWIAVPIVENQ